MVYALAVRVLGIETSSIRGSVALVDRGQTVVVASHERANAHEASIQPLIERVLADAGWSVRGLDRIAVGTGPGSFTGLRVGIALAQGISEGLEIPLVGVGSLQAMALAAPSSTRALRVPLIDARRGEFFISAYDAEGRELLPPQILENVQAVEQWVGDLPGPVLLLGRAWDPGASPLAHHQSEDTDLPHASAVARWGAELELGHPVRPLYLRPAVATAPRLAPNPLSAETRGASAQPLSGAADLDRDGPER
jgi:tRNA threonylcarbamoyladenosine biosynthesis protein TsaB